MLGQTEVLRDNTRNMHIHIIHHGVYQTLATALCNVSM